MHLRRALLLIALILGRTALAATLAPAPRSTRGTQPTPPPAATQSATATAPTPPPTPTVAFGAPPPKRPPERSAAAGAHVIVVVTAASAGEAAIPSLGLVASVDPATPATFDLLVPAGRAAVTFTPALGSPQTIGTLAGTG
jgi:hypothetical protein